MARLAARREALIAQSDRLRDRLDADLEPVRAIAGHIGGFSSLLAQICHFTHRHPALVGLVVGFSLGFRPRILLPLAGRLVRLTHKLIRLAVLGVSLAQIVAPLIDKFFKDVLPPSPTELHRWYKSTSHWRFIVRFLSKGLSH